MFKKVILSASALTAIIAAPAFAGGMAPVVAEPAPAPVAVVPAPVSADWGGFYAGGSLGYGEFTDEAAGDDVDGASYGLFAGYNYDFGDYILGAEAEVTGYDIDEVDATAALKLRAGYDAGAWMPYITAGVEQTYLASDTDDTGYVVGLGLDYQMTDSVRLGAEYLSHQYDDFNDSGSDLSADSLALRAAFTF